jgi:hypothetical protein
MVQKLILFPLIALMLTASATAYTAYNVATDSDTYNCPNQGDGAITGCNSYTDFGDATILCTSEGTFSADYHTGENIILHAYFYPNAIANEQASYKLSLVGDDCTGFCLSSTDHLVDDSDTFATGTFHANGQGSVMSKTDLNGTTISGYYKEIELPMLKNATSGWNYHICIESAPRTTNGTTYNPSFEILKHASDGLSWLYDPYTGSYGQVAGTYALAASFNPEDAPHWTSLADYTFASSAEGWTCTTGGGAGGSCSYSSTNGGSLYVSGTGGADRYALYTSPTINVTGLDYIKVKATYANSVIDAFTLNAYYGYLAFSIHNATTLIGGTPNVGGYGITSIFGKTLGSTAYGEYGYVPYQYTYRQVVPSENVIYFIVNVTGQTLITLRFKANSDSYGGVTSYLTGATVYQSGGSVPDTYTVNSYSLSDTSSSTAFVADIESSQEGGPATHGVTSSCAIYVDGAAIPAPDLIYSPSQGKWWSYVSKSGWESKNVYRFTCDIEGTSYYRETAIPTTWTSTSAYYIPNTANVLTATWLDFNGNPITDTTAYTLTSTLNGTSLTWSYNSDTQAWTAPYTPTAGNGLRTGIVTWYHFGVLNNSATFSLTAGAGVNGTLYSQCSGLPLVDVPVLGTFTDSNGYFITAIPVGDSSFEVSPPGYVPIPGTVMGVLGVVTDTGDTYFECIESYGCQFAALTTNPFTGVITAVPSATIKLTCGENQVTTSTDADGVAFAGEEENGISCYWNAYKANYIPAQGTCTTGQTDTVKVNLDFAFGTPEVDATIDGTEYLTSYGQPSLEIPAAKVVTSLKVSLYSALGEKVDISDTALATTTPNVVTTCSWAGITPSAYSYQASGTTARILVDGSAYIGLTCDSGEYFRVYPDVNDSSLYFTYTAATQGMRLYNPRAVTNGTNSTAMFDIYDPKIPQYLETVTCTVNGSAAVYDGHTYAATIASNTTYRVNVNCSLTGYDDLTESVFFYPVTAALHDSRCDIVKHAPSAAETLQCRASMTSPDNATYNGIDLSTSTFEVTSDASAKNKRLAYTQNDSGTYVYTTAILSSRTAGLYDEHVTLRPMVSWLDSPNDRIEFPHVVGYAQNNPTVSSIEASKTISKGKEYYCTVLVDWPGALDAVSFEFTDNSSDYAIYGDLTGKGAGYDTNTVASITRADVKNTASLNVPKTGTTGATIDTVIYGKAGASHRITLIRPSFEDANAWGLPNETSFTCRARVWYKSENGASSTYSPYAGTIYTAQSMDLLEILANIWSTFINAGIGEKIYWLALMAVPVVFLIIFFEARKRSQPQVVT